MTAIGLLLNTNLTILKQKTDNRSNENFQTKLNEMFTVTAIGIKQEG